MASGRSGPGKEKLLWNTRRQDFLYLRRSLGPRNQGLFLRVLVTHDLVRRAKVTRTRLSEIMMDSIHIRR